MGQAKTTDGKILHRLERIVFIIRFRISVVAGGKNDTDVSPVTPESGDSGI
jgi:hypothetical protein